jgi:hypothetical protein
MDIGVITSIRTGPHSLAIAVQNQSLIGTHGNDVVPAPVAQWLPGRGGAGTSRTIESNLVFLRNPDNPSVAQWVRAFGHHRYASTLRGGAKPKRDRKRVRAKLKRRILNPMRL